MITTQDELQAAVSAGGDVVLDANTLITLTAPITVTASQTRISSGYLKAPPGQPIFSVIASNVEISGTRFAGTGSGAYQANERLVDIVGTKTSPLSQVNIHDCHFWGSDAECIWAEWLTDSSFHDNQLNHFSYAGIMVISGNRLSITGNTIRDGYIASGQVEVYGIALTDLTNVAADRSQNIIIANNILDQIDYEAIDSHGGLNIVVSGNLVNRSVRGIALVQGNNTRITCPMNVAVSGNVVNGYGARATLMEGICLYGVTGGTLATGSIVGNTVMNYSTSITANHYDTANTYIGANVT